MAMKRLYTLFLIMCMAIGVADIAVAQDAPTQKTRYVYLWDVTSSIKPNAKKVTDPNSGLYGRMYDYLKEDVLSKPNGTEIIVVPFNDDVVESLKYEVRNGDVTLLEYKVYDDSLQISKSDVKFANLGNHGADLIEKHYTKFDNNRVKPADPDKGGYTDIAKSLKWAERFISDDYNTFFILLTDGGQEYTADDVIESKGDKAHVHLQNAISHFDAELRRHTNTFNMLFYVITVEDAYSPHKGDKPRDKEFLSNLAYTEFIDADKSTPVIYFCPIKASLTAKDGKISSRDTQFGVRFDVPEGFTLPKDLKVTFNDGKYINYTADLKSSVDVALKSNAKFAVERDSTLTVPVRLSSEPKKVRNNSTIYVYWLDTEKLDLTVTNEFTPIVTVRLK